MESDAARSTRVLMTLHVIDSQEVGCVRVETACLCLDFLGIFSEV